MPSILTVCALAAALSAAAPASAAALRVAQAAPATPAAPAPEAKSESLGTPATVIDGQSAESLLGKKVQSAKGEDLGRIVNVLVDPEGLPRAAVIDFGGFLGVGTRRIAVAWRALVFPTTGNGPAVLDMSVDQIKATPEYHPETGDKPITIAAPPPAAPPAAQSH